MVLNYSVSLQSQSFMFNPIETLHKMAPQMLVKIKSLIVKADWPNLTICCPLVP